MQTTVRVFTCDCDSKKNQYHSKYTFKQNKQFITMKYTVYVSDEMAQKVTEGDNGLR